MRILALLSTFFVAFLVGCTPKEEKQELKSGIWRATLARDSQKLPFLFEVKENSDQKTYTVVVLNGEEHLTMDTTFFEGDSLHLPMRLFDSEIVAYLENDKLIGKYNRIENDKIIAYLPFEAEFDKNYKFFEEGKAISEKQVQGTWSTVFSYPDSDKQIPAVGTFSQTGSAVSGSFLTPSGDYRYLTGSVNGDSLYLSNFDGSNAMLFKAVFQADGTLKGEMWTGVKGYRTWVASLDQNAKLPDTEKITFLKTGFDKIDFSFADLDGSQVSLKDEKFKDKVVILQIMGSWCPTCMDETNYLAPWYDKNKDRGVEIIGLSFETSDDPERSFPKIEKMKKRLKINYPVLLAGMNTEASASAALPMLNKVIYYPTTIFIDRKGKVREIHTGFSGPGTGQYYEEFITEFNQLMDNLIAEK
tara:strand:+ start:544 stop:1791 length:1248 start_codon:yes stop_codon:yes gene_type:complete